MEVVQVLFPLFQVFGFLDFEFLKTLDWASGECIVQIRLRGGILVVYVSVLDSFYSVCHFILSLTLENYKTAIQETVICAELQIRISFGLQLHVFTFI